MSNFVKELPRPVKTYHTKTYDRISPKNTTFDGAGKTMVITGGAAGIGLSICRAFAEAGTSRIVIISRSSGPQEEAKKSIESGYPATQVEGRTASVNDSATVLSVFKELGSIDILVLNATAIDKPYKNPLETTPEEVSDLFNTNVVSAYAMIKGYLELPKPKGGKKTLINLSSAAAHLVVPQCLAYGPSKAAVTQLVAQLAQGQDPTEVQMFSFHPGAYYTANAQRHCSENDFECDDIKLPGDFSVWLASPESAFLHGRMLWAHWDVDELIALKDRIAKDRSIMTIGLVQ